MAESTLTDEQAEEMLKQLSAHFRQPVQPVGRYCAALRSWEDAWYQKYLDLKRELFPGLDGDSRLPETIAIYEVYKAETKDPLSHSDKNRGYKLHNLAGLKSFVETLSHVELSIRKSSLLARLIYGGEKLRTKKCPEHKGRWSGIPHPDNMCPHGCEHTGWIPEP
jgi:hypothetical protein